MIIAVASQNFRTVTPHAGKTRRFILFEAGPGAQPSEIGRIDLPPGMAIHDVQGDAPHPLDRAGVVLAASAGAGFIRKMAERGIVAATTAASDPVEAVRRFIADGPMPPAAAEPCGCGCGSEPAHG